MDHDKTKPCKSAGFCFWPALRMPKLLDTPTKTFYSPNEVSKLQVLFGASQFD
jgi:hypothetical protein